MPRSDPKQAGVAQTAERLTRNEQVRGSIPLPGSAVISQEIGNVLNPCWVQDVGRYWVGGPGGRPVGW